MILVEAARVKLQHPSIKAVAKAEKLSVSYIAECVANGTIVIPCNRNRKLKRIVGVGRGLTSKVNANIGSSPKHISIEKERKKLQAAIMAGADAVMGLSTGGDLKKIRRMVLDECPLPVGTVPMYQASCEMVKRGKGLLDLDGEHLFDVIEQQADEGVDFITVHCGITKRTVQVLHRRKRLVGVVSRGGSILSKWITATGKENPLFEQFDRLLAIAKKYDMTLSLGDGLRPGCLADANDAGQLSELSVLGDLVLRCRKAGVQAMVEGPGHMQLNYIADHVKTAKKVMHNAPYYLLGPLVCDVAAGYDHITGAIGGAIAGAAGADFLCYVTPAEHLRLPNADDVYQGVIASRIAGHAADIVKYGAKARKWDDTFSKHRKAFNWKAMGKLALDPIKFNKEKEVIVGEGAEVCTMCGEFCAMK